MREIIVYSLLFSCMLQLLLATYAWGRRNEPAAKPLLLVFVLGAAWALAYSNEIASDDLQTKLFWLKIYWSAASFGPLVFLLLVLEHLQLNSLLTRARLALLLLPSLALVGLVWSIPHHQLLMYDFTLISSAGLEILERKTGPLYGPLFLVLQGLTILSFYYLIRSIASSSQIKRRQSLTVLCALLVPFLVNIPTILDINPIHGFDFTPIALVFSSGLFAFAIFRYRWLDLLPLARSTLVETMPVGVVVLDAKNRLVDINPSARRLLDLDDALVGEQAETAFARFHPILHSSSGAEAQTQEIRVELPTEQPRHIEVQAIPLKNQDGQYNGRILTLQNITERKQIHEHLQKQIDEIESLHAQLQEQAMHDALTGLYNRRYMNETLERETQRARRHQHPLSLLMIEIDSFKHFNDQFGHEAGDLVLQQVANLIQENTRAHDIACRFGGDEFTMILPETGLEAASLCAERLREAASCLEITYDDVPVGALYLSIGVAVFPTHGSTGAEALRAADQAMYRAKQSGKNQVMVAPERTQAK